MAEKIMTHEQVLEAIQQCAELGQLGTVQTTFKRNGKAVRVLIGYRKEEHNGSEGTAMWPLAMLFDENESPFELLDPPEHSYVVDPASDDTEGGSLD